MNPNLIAWFDTLFDIVYLIAVWSVVYLMTRSMKSVEPGNRQTAGLIRIAFILLAAGDTGLVGFRVAATLLGGSNTQANILGMPMNLLGLGMLMTAYTVTLFYMLFVYIWKARYKRSANWVTNLLLAVGVFRLVFMALPANRWGSLVPPQPIRLYRNLPLLIQGVGVIALILSSAYKSNDAIFKWMGWMITVSCGFYLPVILFAQRFPLIGMLMIPKTCAYLALAWIAYRGLWSGSKTKIGGTHPVSNAKEYSR